MRLLICIAQAALDGPNDQEGWGACLPRIGATVSAYLEHWRGAFELFGQGQRFLQVANLSKTKAAPDEDENNSTSKLDLALATGNNPTLFDNSGGSGRAFAPAELALMVLTFQCFSPGGRIGVALWDGHETAGKGSSKHAPCLAGGILHALLRAKNLLCTVHKNLMTKHQAEQFFGTGAWGKPVWEAMPQDLAHADAFSNATRTYLGRLAPLARAVRLSDDGRSMIVANGLDYPSYADGCREPAATVVVRQVKGQPKRMVLRASAEKGIWRELYALAVKAVGQNPGGPAALLNISEEEGAFDLWVGGIVANKAKLVDTTESVFHVPKEMLGDASQTVYEKGVRHAEAVGSRLMRAVSVFHQELGDKLDRPEMKARRRQIQAYATAQFWTDIEQSLPSLLEVAAAPGELGLRNEWYKTAWGRAVWTGACTAYERACPQATPRQIRAYALGLDALLNAGSSNSAAESEEEVES
jgi:CRISPR system Cascade subunit CasA